MTRHCTAADKKSYPSELEANLQMATIAFMQNSKHAKRGFREEPCRSYRCEFCHEWHLTSQPKREPASRN